ncbi:hypothetical protein [Lactobacillus sp. 3B(2020)]|uniref:hypothetical protein n=1 Tax=Lactobacillus sp. 3B(2020) TaxID=2695882 RepID=UPI0015DFED1E|nr:hypothetical protein [Lactobacillus sp. 3B(2020)]QLL70385.1 hypothetical protein GTO83_07560 [Lactobacillus sp. 3B(2020)]
MAKRLLTTLVLGGAAAATGWHFMNSEKKAAVKAQTRKYVDNALDVTTDYVLEVLDITDGLIADYSDRFGGRFMAVKEQAQAQSEKLAKAVMPKGFDEKTADLRDELKAAKEAEKADDIVIDQTATAEETNAEAGDASADNEDASLSSEK